MEKREMWKEKSSRFTRLDYQVKNVDWFDLITEKVCRLAKSSQAGKVKRSCFPMRIKRDNLRWKYRLESITRSNVCRGRRYTEYSRIWMYSELYLEGNPTDKARILRILGQLEYTNPETKVVRLSSLFNKNHKQEIVLTSESVAIVVDPSTDQRRNLYTRIHILRR